MSHKYSHKQIKPLSSLGVYKLKPFLFFITEICREIRQAGGKGLGLLYPEDGGKNDGINIEWLTDGKKQTLFLLLYQHPKKNEFTFSFAKSSNTDRVQTLLKLIRGLSRKAWKAVLCLPCLHHNNNDNNNKLYLYIVYIFNCSRRLHSRSKFQFQKILKLIHQNYQLKKQNWLVCGLGTATIKQAWILKFAFGTEKFPGLSRNRPLKSRRSSIRLRILVRLWWSPYCTMAIPSSEWTKMDSALNQNFVYCLLFCLPKIKQIK